jgi:hypothetical protein
MPANLNPRDPDDRARVDVLVQRLRQEWADDPNVVAIGPGLKVTGGRPQRRLVVQFFVREKVSLAECEARGWRVIPDVIDDIPTDVESTQLPPQRLATRRARFDPLLGGIAVGNENRDSYGTLGGIAFDNVDGAAVGLTNEHVLVFSGEGATGDPVVQPYRTFTEGVRIVDADCCPGGQLSFDHVPNPLTGILAAGAAVAAAAAAASDVIDPHRRGQQATPVEQGEITHAETVRLRVRYPEMPLPGRGYALDVGWNYERHTDRGVHHHAVDERVQNPHVLLEQELITDRDTYRPADTVTFAALFSPPERGVCRDHHVVAHAVSPSGRNVKRVILRPILTADARTVAERFAGFDPTAPVAVQFLHFRDVTGAGQDPAGVARIRHRGFELVGVGGARLRLVDTLPRPTPDGPAELVVPDGGVSVTLPAGAQLVAAIVVRQHPDPVVMRAFDGDVEVGSDTLASEQGPGLLQVDADRITRVVISGGQNEALLTALGSARRLEIDNEQRSLCVYWGDCPLPLDAELGLWSTYLWIQTVNDVPPGTRAEQAAQTIGGLLRSVNLVSAGRRRELGDVEFCAIDAVADNTFRVVGPGTRVESVGPFGLTVVRRRAVD